MARPLPHEQRVARAGSAWAGLAEAIYACLNCARRNLAAASYMRAHMPSLIVCVHARYAHQYRTVATVATGTVTLVARAVFYVANGDWATVNFVPCRRTDRWTDGWTDRQTPAHGPGQVRCGGGRQ